MANYCIGLDFGTSQTKICLLNKDSDVREFITFDNGTYFLPSLIVKKTDNTFSYGDESENGIKYRYFKMAVAEDDDLIKATNEDIYGHLNGNIENFRKYSTDFDVKPDILVILYISYIYLFIKSQKNIQNKSNVGGLLGRLIGNKSNTQNSFSINLGIPTEWNNPSHINRKIKFQCLLLIAINLANQFDDLKDYLQALQIDLQNRISNINGYYLTELKGKTQEENSMLVNNWLNELNLFVFPESAAGVNYLLKTKRLENGYYATLDIGAGTSDIAFFQVSNNKIYNFLCSESVEVASNDVYRNYSVEHFNDNTFDGIKKAEIFIRQNPNDANYQNSAYKVRFFNKNLKGNDQSLEFSVRKTLFYKFWNHQNNFDRAGALNIFKKLSESNIIVFGGGSNLYRFNTDGYNIHLDMEPMKSVPINNYIDQVNIINFKDFNNINLLVLSLGLTYEGKNDDFKNFVYPQNNGPLPNNKPFHYNYYDTYGIADY
jgi:hypothetical protein